MGDRLSEAVLVNETFLCCQLRRSITTIVPVLLDELISQYLLDFLRLCVQDDPCLGD